MPPSQLAQQLVLAGKRLVQAAEHDTWVRTYSGPRPSTAACAARPSAGGRTAARRESGDPSSSLPDPHWRGVVVTRDAVDGRANLAPGPGRLPSNLGLVAPSPLSSVGSERPDALALTEGHIEAAGREGVAVHVLGVERDTDVVPDLDRVLLHGDHRGRGGRRVRPGPTLSGSDREPPPTVRVFVAPATVPSTEPRTVAIPLASRPRLGRSPTVARRNRKRHGHSGHRIVLGVLEEYGWSDWDRRAGHRGLVLARPARHARRRTAR